MSSSSPSFFPETPPLNARGHGSGTEDDFILEESSSSLEESDNSIFGPSSASDVSTHTQRVEDDEKENANDHGDSAEDKESLRGSQSLISSTPLVRSKSGSTTTKLHALDITAMEPLSSQLNVTPGASAAKPPTEISIDSVKASKKKPEMKQRRRIIPIEDSSDEENESVTPENSYCSSEGKTNFSPQEAPAVPFATENFGKALSWVERSTDIEKDLNAFTSDDEVDDLTQGMKTVLKIAPKESASTGSSGAEDSRQRSSHTKKDHMMLFAQPEPLPSSSGKVFDEDKRYSKSEATSKVAPAFTFKKKEEAPKDHTLDSDSDPAAEIIEEEEQSQQQEANISGSSSSSSSDNRRNQMASSGSDGSSWTSQATAEAAGPSKTFTFKQKEPLVFTIDSDSESDGVEEVFAGLKISEKDQPKKVQPVKKTIFLPDLPSQKPVQKVGWSGIGGGPVSAYDETTSLLAIDKCIQKLTLALENAPKEADERGPPPQRLNVALHPHQSYALEWLFWRENESPFGGILADEMGLGKTVMMLALICRSKETPSSTSKDNGWKSSTEKKLIESEATLVVCPASVMGQWEEETKSKAPRLKVLLWHGSNRETNPSKLAKYDIVVTSYNTVGSEIPKESEQLVCHSPLLKMKWRRVILDEGHIIRNPGTTMAQAACRLSARHRWLVSGTPIHNKSLDFYSSIKFLHFAPFDDLKVWEQWIGKKFPNTRQTQRLQAIGKALLLRRTKLEIAAGPESHQKIPEKSVEDIIVTMKGEEREVYEHIQSFLRDQFIEMLKDHDTKQKELQKNANAFVAGGGQRKPKEVQAGSPSMATFFAIILRCRQAAVLPRLVITMLDDEDDDAGDYDPELHLCSLKNPIFEPSFVSAKLERLFEDLMTLRNEARSKGVPMEKAIVVSQWTTLLDIIDVHLREKGFQTVSITGKTKISDRTDIMMKFNSNKRKPEIMLLSLTAGGCGLNLIGANHLFFMDIHWNPQLELQAQDRIHRFGQTKPVKIKRYISEETMENRVLQLQSEKLQLADGLLTGASASKRSGAGLSIAEMRKLFDL